MIHDPLSRALASLVADDKDERRRKAVVSFIRETATLLIGLFIGARATGGIDWSWWWLLPMFVAPPIASVLWTWVTYRPSTRTTR